MDNAINELEKLSRINPFVWITTNLNLPKGMSWSFGNRRWQIPIINDRSKKLVVEKPAQVGLSTIAAAKMLYMTYHIPMRAAYVLPRDKDFQDMVKTRVNPIISSSPTLLKRMEQKSVDSVSVKQLGESFLHFLASSVEPRMLDLDFLVIDEIDLSDVQNVDLYPARLYASPYKFHYNLSTPSTPNYGIDKLIQDSTMNIWHVKCPFCGTYIPFDKNWLSILKIRKHSVYYGYDCCDMCKDLGLTKEHIRGGEWIPAYPNRTISGYHVIRTMDTTMSASELYDMWKSTSIEKNFITSGLGIPYVSSNIVLDKYGILNSCLDNNVKMESHGDRKGKYYIGIDQGNVLHFVVLRAINDRLELVFAKVLDDSGQNPFNEAAKLISRFNEPFVICDSGPNVHSARNLISGLRKGYLGNFQFSLIAKDNFYDLSSTNDNMILIQKHEALDELVEKYITGGKLRFYTNEVGKADKTIEQIAEHISALKRTTQTRRRMGLGAAEYAVWEPTDDDHFAMCLVYAMVGYLYDGKNTSSRFRWSFIGG